MPILDMEHLARLRELHDGEDTHLLQAMARDFLASVPAQLQLMRELLAAGQGDKLSHEAHGLAGSSGMYGMQRVHQWSRRLESHAHSQDMAATSALLDQVERAFAEARPLLMAELSLPPG